MLLLIHKKLEFLLVQCLLLLLLFHGLLDGVLVSQHLLVQLLACILRVLRIEFSLLPDNLQPSIHVPELEVSSRVRADIPVLVDGRTQYYSLVEEIGDLLVFH